MAQKCLEGAKSAGAEVKLYQISDLKNIKAAFNVKEVIINYSLYFDILHNILK